MNRDEIVEEVREVREQHSKKFNYNIHDICADYIEQQKQYKNLVSFSLKRPLNKTGS